MQNQYLSFTPLLSVLGTSLTVISGLIGFFIKDLLDKNREVNTKNNDIKREMYKKFIDLIIDLFKGHKTNGDNKQKVVLNLVDKLYEFYKDYCLYSSPKVINSFGDFMQYLYQHPNDSKPKDIFRKLSKIIKNMRHELGLSNLGLGRDGQKIFRAMFNDYDKLI